MRRVVITGLGLVTPIGTGRELFWRNLTAGANGIGPVESFDTTPFPVHIGAEVKDFDPSGYVRGRSPDGLGRASQLAVAAARMALEDSGVDVAARDRGRIGVSMGTTSGEPIMVEMYNDARKAGGVASVPADILPKYPCNVIPSHVAIEFDLHGPCLMIPTACAAGNYAIGYGFDMIRTGRTDLMLAGGADSFSRITYMGFARLGAIAPERCQPFDKNRKGMVPGEGAAVLVLEPLDDALARGATIYAEVLGYGVSCDSHHMTAAHPQGDGAIRAMAMALKESGKTTADVDYISAHGTGTPTNDRVEAIAVRTLFGERAPQVPMSSIKSMIGHTMGAASAIEAVACSLAIHTGVIPPTINFEEPDEGSVLDYVPNQARKSDPSLILNNAYAFGGNNASLSSGEAAMMARVVVTGSGVISSIGAGVEEFERNLYAGCSGVGPSPLLGETAVAAEVRNFNPQTWLGNKGIRVLDRSARLLSVAAHMALTATGLQQPEGGEGDPNLGLVCGTMFGSVHSITSFDWSGVTDGPTYVNPMEFPNTVINSPAGQAAIKFKLRGVNSTISAGLVSGLYAIHYASEFLRFGRATALLAGGVEELCEESFLSFARVGVVSARGCPRPFGLDRDGLVLGEGSALWMLETAESAEARGAKALFEICGFGAAHDAHDTQAFRVRGEGATAAIAQALRFADIAPEAIGCVIAGASGSRAGDEMEIHALRNVFGSRLEKIPICAPKAAFGEAMGASGALCALSAGLALAKGSIPPTAGFQAADPGLRLSTSPQNLEGEYALVNCFGCDGNNAALVLKGLN